MYDLPVSITIEEDDEEDLYYKANTPFSQKLYKLREEEEGCLNSFITEEQDEKIGCIKEEELTNIFLHFSIYFLLYIFYHLCYMFIAVRRF